MSDLPRDSLRLAFATSGSVDTIGISGELSRRRLADIVLPTGRIGLGIAGDPVDMIGEVVPEVPPGRYPVFLSIATDGPYSSFAFLSIMFDTAAPITWHP